MCIYYTFQHGEAFHFELPLAPQSYDLVLLVWSKHVYWNKNLSVGISFVLRYPSAPESGTKLMETIGLLRNQIPMPNI